MELNHEEIKKKEAWEKGYKILYKELKEIKEKLGYEFIDSLPEDWLDKLTIDVIEEYQAKVEDLDMNDEDG